MSRNSVHVLMLWIRNCLCSYSSIQRDCHYGHNSEVSVFYRHTSNPHDGFTSWVFRWFAFPRDLILGALWSSKACWTLTPGVFLLKTPQSGLFKFFKVGYRGHGSRNSPLPQSTVAELWRLPLLSETLFRLLSLHYHSFAFRASSALRAVLPLLLCDSDVALAIDCLRRFFRHY